MLNLFRSLVLGDIWYVSKIFKSSVVSVLLKQYPCVGVSCFSFLFHNLLPLFEKGVTNSKNPKRINLSIRWTSIGSQKVTCPSQSLSTKINGGGAAQKQEASAQEHYVNTNLKIARVKNTSKMMPTRSQQV